MKTLLAAVALTALAACADSIVQEPASHDAPRADFVARPLGRMNVAGASTFEGDSESARAARLRLLDRVMERVGRIRTVLRSEGNWHTHLRAVRSELGAGYESAAERWFAEQMAATLILESMVTAQAGGTAGALRTWDDEAASASVDMLLRNESPNAPLVARALAGLEGYWREDRIAAAAATASRNALRWLEQDCAECGRRQEGKTSGVAGGGIDVGEIRRGVMALERLAAGR